MLRRALLGLTGITLGSVPFALRADSDAAAMKELLKDSASVESADVPLSAASSQKLSAALEKDFRPDADGKATLYTAKGLANPLGDPEKLDMAWAAVASCGEAKVAVIAFRDPAAGNRLTVASATLLAPANPSEKIKSLLGALAWKAATPSAYESVSALEARRAAAQAGTDGAAKQTALLLSLLHDMHEIEAQVDAVNKGADAKDAAATQAAAKALAKEFGEAQELLGRSDFVLGAKAGKEKPILMKHAAKAVGDAQATQASAEAKDLEAAAQRANDIACGKCHGSFQKYFNEKRVELKIGDGYFLPGHDLPPAEGDAALLARAVGAAARKALLTIDQLAP